ncbi:MAG: DUF368 domain-containing protein [Thermodesulfobacteriota bacterium]|nr:DUF368 domain-containing protein [Thermodesulfobacteriota bacterium]
MTKGSPCSKRPFKDYLVLAVKGFCMGASDVVPGVSGGTMAFILGIYEELIGAIRSFDLQFLRQIFAFKVSQALERASWRFLLSLGVGILTAIFTLARVLSWLLENRPVEIWSFFFGLVVASALTVSRHFSKWTLSIAAWVALGATLTYLLVGMVPATTPEAPWFLFASGAIAICAMILPGISGAFILVLLGKYHFVLEAVNNRDILTLFLVASGAGLGLVAFARFLHWLFDRHHDLTIALLTGLMLGSLRKVWPWKSAVETMKDIHGNVVVTVESNIAPQGDIGEIAMALLLAALGFFIVFLLDFLAEKKTKR